MTWVDQHDIGGKPSQPDADIAVIVRGNNAFALDLYQQLRYTAGNLFFSPYSIAVALAMTYAGARGHTAREMAQTLHFEVADERLHPALAALAAQVKHGQAQGEMLFMVANALWPQQHYPFRPEFLALLQEHYAASITPVDYGDPETARTQINTWVAEQTQAKIVELIPRGALDPLTRLVLVNALYFKANWASQFTVGLTQPAPFAVTPAQSIEVPMMRQRRAFPYGAVDDIQVLELPYVGEALAMIVLLPNQVDGLAKLEAALTSENLAQWLRDLAEREVDVLLPQFKISHSCKLNDALKTMGMIDAFDENQANFAGMDGNDHWLYLATVLHKAFIDVNEEGTEAAAATGAVMKSRSMPMPTPTFRADHPFIFLICEKSTGTILLLGRVVDPQRDAV